MNKKMLLVAVLGLGAMAVLAGFGGRFGHQRMNPKKAYRLVSAMVENKLDDIDATDAQRTQVNALKDDLFAEAKKLREGHRAARQELAGQWESERVDSQRVHAVVDQQLDALRAFAHQAADAAIKLHGLLSPEQRVQLGRQVPHADEEP